MARKQGDRRKRMDRDLAGQNDTSYQGQPTGLLHGDKLHLRFHSSHPSLTSVTFKFVYWNTHFRYAIDDARKNFRNARTRSVFEFGFRRIIRLIEGERDRYHVSFVFISNVNFINDILFIYLFIYFFFSFSIVSKSNFLLNLKFNSTFFPSSINANHVRILLSCYSMKRAK